MTRRCAPRRMREVVSEAGKASNTLPGASQNSICSRSFGVVTMILAGALPTAATAASPRPTLTRPNSLLSSTTPDSTTSVVLPSGPTASDQSVPRIAAVAAGVAISTPLPPVTARAQTAPESRSIRAGPPSPPTSRTSSWELLWTRIWVWSANRIASPPSGPVRSASPPSSTCCTSASCHSSAAVKRTSDWPVAWTIEPAALPSRGTTAARAASKLKRGRARLSEPNKIRRRTRRCIEQAASIKYPAGTYQKITTPAPQPADIKTIKRKTPAISPPIGGAEAVSSISFEEGPPRSVKKKRGPPEVMGSLQAVILGLDPRIQGMSRPLLGGRWIAGSSPAMTMRNESC